LFQQTIFPGFLLPFLGIEVLIFNVSFSLELFDLYLPGQQGILQPFDLFFEFIELVFDLQTSFGEYRFDRLDAQGIVIDLCQSFLSLVVKDIAHNKSG
jgi:hypothetical protein